MKGILKVARISGAEEPHMGDASIPYKRRVQAYKRYVHEKANEEPTSTGRAAFTGGGIGTVLGGIAGLAAGPAGGAAGALVGGAGGALIGGLMAESDRQAIRRARRLKGANKKSLQYEVDHKISRERADREAQQAIRHYELMHAISRK